MCVANVVSLWSSAGRKIPAKSILVPIEMAILTMGFPIAMLDYWRDFLILDIISEVPPRAPAKLVFRVNAGLW